MTNKSLAKSFRNRFKVVYKLVISSKNNKIFIDSALRFLDFFQNDPITKELNNSCEKELAAERDLRRCGFRELSDAVEEIRKRPKKNLGVFGDPEEILEEVRREGCCVDPVDLMTMGYSRLKRIFLYVVEQNSDRLTFAPTAYRCTGYYKCFNQSNSDNHSTWENTDLYSCWKDLIKLKEYWSYRDNDAARGLWPRIEGEGLELWLEADRVRNQACSKMIGGSLKFVDEHNFDKKHFCREYYQNAIEIFCREILGIISPNASLQKTRNDPRIPDKEKAVQFIKQYYDKHPKANHDEIIREIRKHIIFEKKGGYADSTLKTWIRPHDPREKTPRGRGKSNKPGKKS